MKCPGLDSRYLSPDGIAPLVQKFSPEVIGKSVRGEAIPLLTLGNGPIRILAWSQMHGNESTTTRALADFLNGCLMGELDQLLSEVTLKIIPQLNPDGSRDYSRTNAAGADLNRDFVNLSQPESRALWSVFEQFNPDFCFNLHDQRTIFGAGETGKPATVSFLAPSYDHQKSMNPVRKRAVEVICAINEKLQKEIPGCVGRFDDGFNPQCVGDAFTAKGAATILFEAGHFRADYHRHTTRKLIFKSLVWALEYIGSTVFGKNRLADYLLIPQNKICFYDIVYKNVKINYDSNVLITNFAVQYREEPFEGDMRFVAEIA